MSSNALKWLLILDFEANCGDNIRPSKKNQEVIEWPTLLYNFEADILEDTFHEYIKPVVLPEITPFCTELTGIEQVRLRGSEFASAPNSSLPPSTTSLQ